MKALMLALLALWMVRSVMHPKARPRALDTRDCVREGLDFRRLAHPNGGRV